ncbi:unnamed protein product [Closterium sp. NIES-64]|nr:unnamed protein product [Closterium sp. NIES-64]
MMPIRPCSAVHHAAQPGNHKDLCPGRFKLSGALWSIVCVVLSYLPNFLSNHLSLTAGRPNTKQYIVHLSSVPPVLSYRGGVNGLQATATVDDEDDEYEDEEDVDDVGDEDYGEDGDAVGVAAAAAGGAERGLGGVGSGGGGIRGAVKVSALPFGRTGVDALVERVGQRLRKMKSRSVGRRLLARVAAAAVAAAAEEAAAAAAGGGAGAAAAAVTQPFQNSSFYPSTVSATVSSVPITLSSASSSAAPREGGASSASASSSAEAAPVGEKAPMASGATSAVLTVQQLSARAARIMRSTPWGRLTRPDVRLPHVQDFTRFLEASHRSLLQSLKIPSSAIFHRWGGGIGGKRGGVGSYTYLMNSFAAQLTAAEVRRLKLHPAVADVERDRTVRVTSVHSPQFLKLDSSLWPANGGQSNAGEGVIIGVIDTGIWPEHPSFSNPPEHPSFSNPPEHPSFSNPVSPNTPPSPTLPQHPSFSNPVSPNTPPSPTLEAYSAAPTCWRGECTKRDDPLLCGADILRRHVHYNAPPPFFLSLITLPLLFGPQDQNGVPYSAAPVRWRGVCSTTDDFTACNGKVVGASYARHAGWTCSNMARGVRERLLRTLVWTSKAAAGNAGVEVTTGGRTYGTASGMAPRARLAIYKALWNTVTSEGVGSFSDLVAAAENAVADGVDVISCSWGGPLPLYFQDLPYLRGLKAGVVTAFAAGNSGRPNSKFMWGTLSTASPFYLTVGASTMGRDYKAVVTLGDGTTLTGRSLGGNTATALLSSTLSSSLSSLPFCTSPTPPSSILSSILSSVPSSLHSYLPSTLLSSNSCSFPLSSLHSSLITACNSSLIASLSLPCFLLPSLP